MIVQIDDDRLSETFSALANSTRRAILARLAAGEASVNELAEPFDLTLPAISKHIKVLEHAGLIARSHRAQYRPIWEARFDRMNEYVNRLQPREIQGRS